MNTSVMPSHVWSFLVTSHWGDAYILIHDFSHWNHLFLSYPWHADFKTAFVFKIGPILVEDVNF